MTDQSIDPQPAMLDDLAASGSTRPPTGSAENTDAGAVSDPMRDKYNDPRVSITRRGVLLGVGVLLFGIVGAATSIYLRKTRLEQTTAFWGQDTITALQLGERMHLMPRGGSDFEPVELTATPGLGHLRRALLDERSFDWSTTTDRGALEDCRPNEAEAPSCIQIRLTDPTAHRFEPVEIDLDLSGGWVGPSDGSRRVQATEWVQPKLRHYFATIINVQQKRFDLRTD